MLQYSPKIITDSLVMCLDASQNKSYPTTDLPVKGGLVMWMDAADDSTFSYSSGTTVSQWRDKSGFNYHMVPVSAGPTRNAFLNSRKVLAFTNTQDIQNLSIDLRTSAYSVFVVDRYTNPSSGTQRILTSNSGLNNWLLGHWASEVNKYYANGWIYSTYVALDTNWKLYLGDWGGPSNDLANFYGAGTAIATNSADAAAGPWGLGVNANSGERSNCEAAEIIVFNRLLTATERRLVHTYLGQKWGILNTDRSAIDLGGQVTNTWLLGDGTTANMPSYSPYNKTFTFDGSNDLITYPYALGTFSSYTFSFWARRNVENKMALSSYGNASFYWFGDSSWAYTHGGVFGEKYYNKAVSIPLGSYGHYCVTYDGGTVRIYRNGVFEDSQSTTGNAVFNVGLQLGKFGSDTTYMFSGDIANFLMYGKALSAAEVAQNYQAQKSRFDNYIITRGLVLNLDAGNPYSYAGAGTTWYDVSGNGNHATLYNSPTWNSNGYFSLNGTNNYIKTTNTLDLSAYNAVTVLVIFKPRSYPVSGNVKFICELSTDFNSFTTGFVWTYNDNSASQNYEVIAGVKGDAGYNMGAWNKNNYNDLNWEISTAVFNKSTASPEVSLYNQGVAANVISNPIAGLTANNTNNFGNDYLFIGSRAGTSYFTDLDIVSILVYNRALSAAEILQNYNAVKGRFGL